MSKQSPSVQLYRLPTSSLDDYRQRMSISLSNLGRMGDCHEPNRAVPVDQGHLGGRGCYAQLHRRRCNGHQSNSSFVNPSNSLQIPFSLLVRSSVPCLPELEPPARTSRESLISSPTRELSLLPSLTFESLSLVTNETPELLPCIHIPLSHVNT